MDYKAIIRALLLLLSFAHTIAFGSSNISCPDSERKALLRFARGFNRTAEAEREAPLWFARGFNQTAAGFSSWEGKDCCKWEGVKCDDRTGHVVHLDLQGRGIVGNRINPSLLCLKQLSYLDLSGNFFDFISIPPWIGSFKKLNYLNLSLSYFNGTIPDQLGNLSRLQTLDLSRNYDLTLSNADWLSRLTSLLHIDMNESLIEDASSCLQALNMLPLLQDIHLQSCKFGNFPQSLPHVNFTSLSLLDLSWTSLYDFSNNSEITSSLPDWLFGITSLQYLSLFRSGFTVLIPSAIGNLTSLKVLELDDVDINAGIPSSLSNLCELRTLSLSFSTINSQLDALEASFSGCLKSSLRELYLRRTSLSGNMLDLIGDLNNLNILDLSFGSFSGSIPTSFCKLSTLQELYIYDKKINGTVPECFGNLSELRFLDLSYNSLIGVISEYHFSNLTELESIDLSSNSLILNLSYSWVPPFQLGYLGFGGCKLGPKFPSWLRTQKSLTSLDLSSTGISDSVPNWFWNSMTNLSTVYLANNELHGVLPNLVNFSDDAYLFIDLSSNFFTGPMPSFPSNTAHLDLSNNSFSGPIPYDFFHGVLPKLVTFSDDALLDIDLSSNFFEGPVPIFPSNTEELDLSDNSFMGPIPYDFFQLMPNLAVLSLSMNKINGKIPMSICNSQLAVISISNNNLSGELPNCQNNTPLEFLELSNNNLSGGVPKWLCECPSFQSLHLRKNSLSGELPLSLKTCKSLNTLDLGGNMFTGRIPIWFGELSFLKILSLKSNKFVGRIPSGLSNLTALQILDLSNNNLSGPIPMSFGNFTTMRTTLYRHHPYIRRSYDEGMILDIKGREDQYDGQLLSDVTILDLSKNSLSGCIPNELTNLLGLMVFDLSSNDLTGQIPFKIGDLTQLLYLDLSRNKLSGAIPSSLSNLTFLEILNISYNNFSGRIPTGKQMDTFVDPKIYVGNQYLCGFQINVSCTGNEGEAEGPTIGQSSHTPTNISENADENRKEILLLCLITIAGFAVGFWAITGVLLVHKRFRIWWFRYVDSLYDSLYVISRVWFARLKKKMSKINTTDG